jgi:diguanylate cyclase (GGDEF)-like protein
MTEVSESQHWFLKGLGARIDAVAAGLQALAAGDANAGASLRRQAQTLAVQAESYRIAALCEAARRVEQSTDGALEGAVRGLVSVLRDEAAKARHSPTYVLLVGGRPDLNEELLRHSQDARYEILQAETAAEAMEALQANDVVLIVLSLCLPDMDGRTFLLQLRENPRIASIPVLLLAPRLTDAIKEDDSLCETGGVMEEPFDAEHIATWIRARLRRAHETVKAARRDRPTGLLNRIGLREAYERALRECAAAQEPLTLAAISVDSAGFSAGERGDAQREDVLQAVSAVLSRTLRASDVIGRWAPCEFVILLPGEDTFGGCRATEKAIQYLRREPVGTANGNAITVDVAAGVTTVAPGVAIEDAVEEADRYVCQAVAAGGNRVASKQSADAVQHPAQVLLVMAEDVTSRVLRRLFENDGVRVEHLPSCDAALPEAITQHRFRLVLIDENVPARGGLAVLRDLRQTARFNRVPIVVLTAGNAEDSVARALEQGATDYVTRPIPLAAFMTRMRRLMSRGLAMEQAQGRERVLLLIDDDPKQLFLAASALHQRGAFRVHLAKGLRDGYRRMEEERPQTLVVSVNTAGFQTAEFVRNAGRILDLKKTAVVLAGDESSARSIAKEFPDGVTGVIARPFSPLTIGEELEKITGGTPGAAQSPAQRQLLNEEIQRILKSGDV